MTFFLWGKYFFVFKGRVKIKEILILDKMKDLIWITLMVMLPLGRDSQASKDFLVSSNLASFSPPCF